MPPTRRSVRLPRRKRAACRPAVELLEGRTLPAGLTWPAPVPPQTQPVPNEVLAQAQDLGTLNPANPVAAAAGTLGNGPAGPADVAWYSFTLPSASHVALATGDAGTAGGLVSALSLYATDPYNYDPPYGSPSGYRLLAQNQGNPLDPDAHVESDLAPGTYYVAVSGAGNLYFHPLLADSGSAGSTGPYTLEIATTDLGLDPNGGPVILGGDPAPGSQTAHSPVVIHVDFSAPLNLDTVHLNHTANPIPIDPFDPLATDANGNPQPVPPTVWLTYNPSGDFGDGNDQPVLLAGGDVSLTADELRVSPAAPLEPGYYKLFLAGNTSQHGFVVTDVNGNPLGADADHPSGQDLTYTFQVTGVEGRVGPGAAPDDTPATAQELGDVTHLVQVPGTIGDNPNFTGPMAGADVDLYHFRLTGPGRYAFVADVFAGRIGSPLDPGVSLFQLDTTDHTLHLIAANDNTINLTTAADGSTPLAQDAAVYAGLTAGDYYVAVSASGNVPDPAEGLAPGVNGVFDLNAGTPYTGAPGLSTGDYVLNVLAEPAGAPPQVVSVTPADGSLLTAPPTDLTVQFNEPVVLQQLAYRAYQAFSQGQQASPDTLAAVTVVGTDGMVYHPELVSYDRATSTADFLMSGALPNGSYALHLSGADGLTDFVGQPLVGNDPSGDYVVHFQVHAAPRGTAGDTTLWTDQEPNDSLAAPQVLGPLFPDELQANNGSGVVVRRDFSQDPAAAPHDTEDNYQIQVLQQGEYLFNLVPLSGSELPPGTLPQVYDASGNQLLGYPRGTSAIVRTLNPGTYVVRVGGWSADQAPGVTYELHISLLQLPGNPTPLTVGPEPTFRIQLTAPPPPSPAPIRLVLPPAPPADATAPVTPVAVVPARAASSPMPAPADGLLALAAGPVGGVTTTTESAATAPPPRLLVSGPGLVARERLLQVAVLTGTDNVGGGDGDTAEQPVEQSARLQEQLKEYLLGVVRSWQELLDSMFPPGPDAEATPGTDAAPEGASDGAAEDSQPAPADGPGEAQAAPPPAAAPPARSGGAALASLLAGALAAEEWERKRRPARDRS